MHAHFDLYLVCCYNYDILFIQHLIVKLHEFTSKSRLHISVNRLEKRIGYEHPLK